MLIFNIDLIIERVVGIIQAKIMSKTLNMYRSTAEYVSVLTKPQHHTNGTAFWQNEASIALVQFWHATNHIHNTREIMHVRNPSFKKYFQNLTNPKTQKQASHHIAWIVLQSSRRQDNLFTQNQWNHSI